MKLICKQEDREVLLERLTSYLDLDITLIQQGVSYQGLGYVFTLNQIEELIKYLETYKQSKYVLSGSIDDRLYFINVKDIYYVEGFSKECFIHTIDKEYLSKLKLYEIEDVLKELTFVRISKSVIVNLRYIDYMLPETNMRFGLYLKNGIKVLLNRNYIKEFKNKVKMR